MDLAFLRRAEAKFASRAAARIDYGLLLALLRTQQEQACAHVEAPAEPCTGRERREALITLLTGAAGWQQASRSLGGSFSPSLASFGNTPSTSMTGKFTFAFQSSFKASQLQQRGAGGFAPQPATLRGYE
jgi:hypothetical protein